MVMCELIKFFIYKVLGNFIKSYLFILFVFVFKVLIIGFIE